MKVQTVAVTYGRKFNLGNYEMADLSCHVEATVEEGDDEAQVAAQLWSMARRNVQAEFYRVKGKSELSDGVALGLPGRYAASLPAHMPIANGSGKTPSEDDLTSADELEF